MAARVVTVQGRPTSTTTTKGHIRKFGQITHAETNQTCLTCHNRGDHAGWEGSAHERRDLSCTTCHSVHSPKSFERQLVKTTQTELCATCHRLQTAKTERAVAHMPVREGKMSCSSCHNPHGSISNVKALKVGSSVNETCYSCHAEMRGPTLWEHAPVRENCTHVPRSAWLVERPDARRAHADALPAVPHRHEASLEHLRQRRHHREQEQPDVRTIVHELPPEHPRIEPSVRPVLHAIAPRGRHAPLSCSCISSAALVAYRAAAQAQSALSTPPALSADSSSTADSQRGYASDAPAAPASATEANHAASSSQPGISSSSAAG